MRVKAGNDGVRVKAGNDGKIVKSRNDGGGKIVKSRNDGVGVKSEGDWRCGVRDDEVWVKQKRLIREGQPLYSFVCNSD